MKFKIDSRLLLLSLWKLMRVESGGELRRVEELEIFRLVERSLMKFQTAPQCKSQCK